MASQAMGMLHADATFAISPGIGQPGGYVIERAFVEK